MQKIIVILGPTGSGKSNLIFNLDLNQKIEIINADSRQIYQELDIGTAKPTEEQLLRIPHHLYNHWLIDQPGNAGLYQKQADQVIQEVLNREKIPVVVGGTGLYIKSLLFGFSNHLKSDQTIRDYYQNYLMEYGIEALYQELVKIDPKASKEIHPHHSSRIIRALEVFKLTGKSIIDWHEKDHQNPRYDYLKIGIQLDRNKLYQKIDQRVDSMMRKGLIQEVEALWQKYQKSAGSEILQRSIGYQEIILFLNNQIILDQAVELIKKNTRNYAKRQLTWFRKEEDIRWFLGDDLDQIKNEINKFITA